MQSFLKKRYWTWLGIFLGIFLIFQNFQANVFGLVEKDIFRHFDDSDLLVVGKVIADDFGIDTKNANLGFIFEGEHSRQNARDQAKHLLKADKNLVDVSQVGLHSYRSHYGLQGVIFSWLFNSLDVRRISYLQSINAFIFTIILCALSFCFWKIFDKNYAFIFLVTSVSSSWVTVFAKSLYWMPSTWYLPPLFAALACLTGKKKIFYFFVYFSFFIKSLMGYEYITSITLFACSIFLIEPFFRKSKVDWKEQIRETFTVFALCVAGFLSALIIHAFALGHALGDGTFWSGLKIIFLVASRRTFGDPDMFNNERIKAGLEASIPSVVETYVMHWNSTLFLGLPGILFPITFFFLLFNLFLKILFRRPEAAKHLALFFVSLSAPMSWFILGKAHSFVHIHLNYVLWYFGFITAMVYILTDDALSISHRLLNKKFKRKVKLE